MDFKVKVVTRLPLNELWNERKLLHLSRKRSLSENDLADLLRLGPVQFIVANVGEKLRWIRVADCYRFWTSEAKPHLAPPQLGVPLDDFPDSYCFLASEWIGTTSVPVVVLERHH